ncbi:hypothetical protein ID47_00110 [Candidatus Paracaedibacter acanthamoebae]|uniref:Uncharacterized protein n=2 Tax=Candidatus Odyssella acanthamoebae TaxID=91604 RepID=A0A077AT20_9PROT|nr:hypothetical protein ID47_00110 [Candidatus Paracaedibacter acanthamoebae]
MRASTRNLRADIQSGTINATTFTLEQLAAINAGKAKIPGMTWHHDQQARRMQLIPTKIHKEVPHIGSTSLSK